MAPIQGQPGNSQQQGQLLRSKRWSALALTGVGLLGSTFGLAACGESTQLGPIELALLLADNVVQTDLVAGEVGGFVEFDVRRERDDLLFRDPLNVFATNAGLAEEQPVIVDRLNNTVFTQRAVAFLGNGPDLDGDGIPAAMPQDPPQPLDPLAPYAPITGWQSRAALAYVPNQTTIPGRAGTDRFSLYVSSMLPFNSLLRFSIRDQSGQVFASETTLTVAPTPTQPINVFLDTSVSPESPVVITICNQLGSALYVGLKAANLTTLDLPIIGSSSNTALSDPIAYRAEAYQFEVTGTFVIAASGTPATGAITTPIGPDGTATLSLTPTGPDGRELVSCAGDRLGDLVDILPGFF